MVAPDLSQFADNRPHNRARLREELRRSMKRRQAILQETAVEAVIDVVVLELAAQRETLAGMIEKIKEYFGEMNGEQLDRFAHVVLHYYLDEKGDVHLPGAENGN